MLVHICRLMILIFLFNIVAPQLVQAQQVPPAEQIERSVRERVEQMRGKQVAYSLNMTEEEALTARDTRLEELADLYDLAETPQEMQKIVVLMHQTHEQYVSQYKEPKSKMQEGEDLLRQQQQNMLVQPNDAIPTPAQLSPAIAIADQETAMRQLSASRNSFLRRLNNDEITPDELVEYIDPLDPSQNDLTLTMYAGEVLSNDFLGLTLIKEEEIDKATIEELVPFALRLQQRAFYRLEQLNKEPLVRGVIMARGTLRLLLYRIHQFLKKYKKEDSFASMFADEQNPQNQAPGARTQVPQKIWIEYPTRAAYDAYVRRVEAQNARNRRSEATARRGISIVATYEVYKEQNTRRYTHRPTTAVPRGYKREEKFIGSAPAPRANNNRNRQNAAAQPDFKIPANPMADFVKEFKELKQKDPKAGSEDFYNLQLQTQYTTRYFLLTQGETSGANVLDTIINALEKKPSGRLIGQGYNPTDYETQYSAIIDDFYHTIYETVRAFPMDATMQQIVLKFLEDSAGPSHATDTRVSALAAASLLNRANKPAAPYSMEWLKQQEQGEKPENALLFDNKIWLSDDLRDKLGRYVVDIYKPLQTYHYEDYGQDSDQMVAMGDLLAYIYEGFLPLLVPGTKWEKNNCAGYPSVRRADYEHRVMLQALEDNSRGYITQTRPPSAMGCQEDEFKIGTTIVRGSDGRAVGMWKYNYPNQEKVKDEYTQLFFRIVGEAVLWVYGGEIIVGAFRAFSCVRGAVIALPRAIKAANAVNKGSKLGRFSAKIRQGIRYSNFNSNLVRNGVLVTATRTERVRVPANNVPPAPASTPLLAGERTASSAGSVMAEAPVTRAGTGYVTGISTQKGTTGFWGRLWNKITGNTPEITSYNVAIHRHGVRFAGVELDAASLGLMRGLNSPMDKVLFQRAYQRALMNAPESFEAWRIANNAMGMEETAARTLYAAQRDAAQRMAQEFLNPLGYTERQLIANERTFMAATGQALKTDATAAGLNSGKFDYWAFDGQKWARVSAKDFNFRGQFLNNTTKSHYELLGVSPQASTREINKAYQKLAKLYHPDKLGQLPPAVQLEKEAEFKKIAEAVKVLRDPEKRAAYDAALAKLAQTTGEQTGSLPSFLKNVVLPKSPEGYSLAITPKTGIYPENGVFNPITGNWSIVGGSMSDGTLLSRTVPGVKGLGFNGANWGTGDISAQVTQHLINEGQLSVLGDLVLSNSPFTMAFKSNLKFFAGWDVLDRGAFLLQKPYLTSKAHQELQNEMDKYGDVFAGTNTNNNAEQTQLSPDNWNVYNQLLSAKQDDHRGALITLPYLVTRQTLSEHGIGTTPLLNDQTRAMLETAAQTSRLNKALENRQIVKNEKNFSKAYETVLSNISAQQQEWKKNLSMGDATLWGADLKEIDAFFEEYKRQLQAIAASPADAITKANQMNELITKNNSFVEKFNNKLETKLTNILMVQAAPEDIDKWYEDLFASLNAQRQEYAEYYALIEGWSDLGTKIDRLFDEAIKSVQASRNKNDSFAKQYDRYTTIMQKLDKDLAATLQHDTMWQNMNPTQISQSLELTYGADIMQMYREENVLVMQDFYGEEAKEETERYCRQIEARMAAILGNNSLSLEKKKKQAEALMEEYANHILELYKKYEEKAAKQGPTSNNTPVTNQPGEAPATATETIDMSQDDEMFLDENPIHSQAY